jgi:hypothetical protein
MMVYQGVLYLTFLGLPGEDDQTHHMFYATYSQTRGFRKTNPGWYISFGRVLRLATLLVVRKGRFCVNAFWRVMVLPVSRRYRIVAAEYLSGR